MATYSLDVLGEVCPIPLLRTQQKFQLLLTGDTLVVETDFSRSVRNIMEWAEKNNLKFAVENLEDGVWQVCLTK
jgi:TusA-related sulfurtransferase